MWKSNWFCITRYAIGLLKKKKKLVPTFNPIRSKTSWRAHTAFPALLVTSMCLPESWLVHWIAYVTRDWPRCLLCFWFYDTQLKTALSQQNQSKQEMPAVTLGKRGKSSKSNGFDWLSRYFHSDWLKDVTQTKWSDSVDIRKQNTETNSKIPKNCLTKSPTHSL